MKKKMLKVLKVIGCFFLAFIVFAVVILFPRGLTLKAEINEWNGGKSFKVDDIKTLEMKDDEFRILQLSDIQFDYPISKAFLKATIKETIAQSNPDLIVLAGDSVAGVLTHFYVNSLNDIFDSYGIPWAPVFGNHDRELGSSLYYQAKRFSKSKYCLFKQGPSNISGVGNYVINLTRDDKPVYSLFLMDSNAGRVYNINGQEINSYDYIHNDQIKWYEDNINGIKDAYGGIVPSMTFFHIPLPEFKTAYDLTDSGSDEAALLFGDRREVECPPLDNSGFFDTMLGLGSTTHIFVGHDHVNNYSVTYKGIQMTYGVKTGNFSYWDEDRNGGTLITIGSDVKVEHIYVNPSV